MTLIENIVALTVMASALGLGAKISICQRRERDFAARLTLLSIIILLHATVLAVNFANAAPAPPRVLQASGFLVLALCGGVTWLARPLWIELPGRRGMLITVALTLLGFGLIQATNGLFHFVASAGHGSNIIPNVGGKFFLAAVIVGSVFLFSKYELFTRAMMWRYGKRGNALVIILAALILAVIMLSCVSLVYGRISPSWLIACQLLCAAFFIALLLAPQNTLAGPVEHEVSGLRLVHYLSSGALIYAGIYLIGFGLLVKVMMLLGGSWEQFVSFLAALGAIVLALALLTAESLRHRWTRFVERNLLANTYDFRRELKTLTEAISMAANREQLIETVCRKLADIFSAMHCHLFVEENGAQTYRLFSLDEKGKFTIAAETDTLSHKQIAWLERMHESFAAENFLNMEETPKAANNWENGTGAGRFLLGTPLFAGQRLLGGILLGAKRLNEPYSEEEKQLLEILSNAISIALHGTYLQQHLLTTRQMESIYRVASFMLHDLRNAISTLNLLAQNATAHLEKKNFRADFIAALTRVAQEMQSLMQRLAAVKAGGEVQRFAECRPDDLVYDALADLALPAKIKLKEDVPTLPRSYWDRAQIRLVLRNLLLNAIEAMPDGGTLTIAARHQQEQIHFTIGDTGIGMSPEFIRRRLFKPNQTTKAKGLGIGLYQSREIINAHQGKILVKSQPEAGTTFEIILPCRPVISSPAEEANGPTYMLHPDWLNVPVSRFQIAI